MLPAALPLNAFCPSPALLKHISTGPAYSKHNYVHFQVGEEGQLMTCWTAKYFLSYVGFLFVCFFFSSYNSVQKKCEHRSSKLSSDTKGQPVVLLPRYNWIHCELSYLECFLPVCICMNGPSAHTYKLMQYAEMKAVPVLKGFSVIRVGRAVSQCCPCLRRGPLAGDSSVFFFFFFCSPPCKMNSLQSTLV